MVVRAEPPAFERPRPEVLEHHVALLGEAAHQRPPLVLPQIDGDALLVAAEAVPPERDAVLHAAPGAHGIARAGRLDLDDLGPEVAEDRAREGTGHELAQLEHADPVERPSGPLQVAAASPVAGYAVSISRTIAAAAAVGSAASVMGRPTTR